MIHRGDSTPVRDKINVNQSWLLEKLCLRAARALSEPSEVGDGEGGDDYSHIVAQLSSEVLRQADSHDAKAANGENRLGRAIIVRMDTVVARPVDWLWDKKIARGKLTLWVGDPGVGKSTGSTDIAARVSAGLGFPDGSPSGDPAGVVLISAEDGTDDTIRPRLDVAGADVSRISLVQSVTWFDENLGASERQLDLQRDLPALEEAIQQTKDCALVIVDPIAGYMGRTDSHKNAEVRAVLTPLAKMAEKHNVAFLGITHLNKTNARAMDRVTGSLAFVAQARAVWVVGRDKQDNERRLVACLKNNLAKDALGMAYKLIDVGGHPRVEWEPDPVEISADNLLAPPRTDAPRREAKRKEVDQWLSELLGDGPMPAKEVEEQAKGAGVAWAAVRAASGRLDIVPYREGGRNGHWMWALPQRCGDSPSQNVSTFDKFDTFE
jgi:hypothetical protein